MLGVVKLEGRGVMDQKLTELVNKVESEARAFASFNDYLASKEKDSSEWQKPASDVAEKSSSEFERKGGRNGRVVRTYKCRSCHGTHRKGAPAQQPDPGVYRKRP